MRPCAKPDSRDLLGRPSSPTLVPSLSVMGAMPVKQLQKKTSLAFDDWTMKMLRKHADRDE